MTKSWGRLVSRAGLVHELGIDRTEVSDSATRTKRWNRTKSTKCHHSVTTRNERPRRFQGKPNSLLLLGHNDETILLPTLRFRPAWTARNASFPKWISIENKNFSRFCRPSSGDLDQ